MSDNAPMASGEFQKAHDLTPVDHPAEPEVEEPSEYRVERHLTPGGEIEQIVHTQLDQQHRTSILAAQQRYSDGIDENGNVLDVDQVPGAAEEYNRLMNSPDNEQDSFEQRMQDRFQAAHDREVDLDR